jgi:starch synthase (maltosyl-transferring)
MQANNEAVLIYNLFPKLFGAFKNWKPHIHRAATMHFSHIYINPICYPGFSGSLYSIKDYDRIHDIFIDDASEMDPWDQFKDIIDYTHSQGLKLIFDLVINHTAIDNPWTTEKPEWYKKDAQGNVAHPYCIEDGKKKYWGDLAELDLDKSPDKKALWLHWQNYVNRLIDMGIDGFRCDAAYQVPTPFWQQIIRSAKANNPVTQFFAETLGCPPEDIVALTKAGFDYTFNSSKWWDFKEKWGMLQYQQNAGKSRTISFPESHDTIRTAAEVEGDVEAIKMKYAFSALFTTGVMTTSGFEFANEKRINVVQTTPKDWVQKGTDIQIYMQRVNDLKRSYRVFHEDCQAEKLKSDDNILALLKTSCDLSQRALIIINHDTNAHREFYHPDLFELFEHAAPLRNVSPEYAMSFVPKAFHYDLRPAQVIVLLQERTFSS